MIAQLTGTLADSSAESCVIDVHGVGWLVHASGRTLASLGAAGENVTLFTRMQVSENDMRLIGFASAAERDCYSLLIGVQGVGSKVALAILSALTPQELHSALASADTAMVARAQGVGPKLARRIVNELKDKAGTIAGSAGAGITADGAGGIAPAGQNMLLSDAQSALANLGFKPAEAQRAVHAAAEELDEDSSLDELVRLALKKGGAMSDHNPEEQRIIDASSQAGDPDTALRPKSLSEFIGQKEARENLRVFVEAAKQRGEALDHVLLFGPPGLGKTTLAQILAREMGVGFRATSGPVIAKSGDLAALLTNLEAGDVLFIDEIHRLNPVVEEILYPAMEDRALDLIIGEGPSARSVRIDLAPFTLVGATTRQGLLSTPLRDRFGIPVRLNFYSVDELERVVHRAARLLDLALGDDGAHEIARRARGTPRVAGRLLRRVRDFALVDGAASVDAKMADAALRRLDVDGLGLDAMDRRYLLMIADIYKGGPVGVETLAAGLSEPRDTIEDVIEPYLIQLGLVARTARGRMLNDRGWSHLGLNPPADTGNPDLFSQSEK